MCSSFQAVTDRLMQEEDKGMTTQVGAKARLKGFIAGAKQDKSSSAAPIADLFPHCTVFFADIAGFTAWSSTREPSQGALVSLVTPWHSGVSFAGTHTTGHFIMLV